MGVSDKFEASVHDDAGEPEEKIEPPAHTTENGGVIPTPTPAPDGERSGVEAPRRRTTKKSLEETEALLRRLEQAGFSRAEAGRLIFERLRPREEGLART
jgi:hypothetical protein